ncbi:DoxX family protein [Flavobacterium terrae]|uniref:DoxX-like family protein n=1 Tax=Flavobacterium terrae TaxID=415425 RepID=A0A1M6H197_9FLAO|nr:DoxX family protein [Flavobacterium terrae]SHJ15922.1 DoxX-like family protein [Flavobacterium terrae]
MKTINLQLVLKIALAIILVQTLFFKFTASQESVYIFSKLNVEPYGRIGSGIIELFASFLLFFKRTKFYASLTVLGTMLGAIVSHVTVLGIEVMNDGGMLFLLASVCFFISAYLVFLYKNDFINDFNQLKK